MSLGTPGNHEQPQAIKEADISATKERRPTAKQRLIRALNKIHFWRKAKQATDGKSEMGSLAEEVRQSPDSSVINRKESDYGKTEEGIDQVTTYFSEQTNETKRKDGLDAIRETSQSLLRLSPEQMDRIANFSKTLHVSRVDLLTQALLLSTGLNLDQMNVGQLTPGERDAIMYGYGDRPINKFVAQTRDGKFPTAERITRLEEIRSNHVTSRESVLVSERDSNFIEEGKDQLNEIASFLGLNSEQAQQLLLYQLDTPRADIETQALQVYEGRIYPGNAQRIIDRADVPSADPRWDPVTTEKTAGYRFGKYLDRYVNSKPDIQPIGDIVLPEGKRTLPFLSLALATPKALYHEVHGNVA